MGHTVSVGIIISAKKRVSVHRDELLSGDSHEYCPTFTMHIFNGNSNLVKQKSFFGIYGKHPKLTWSSQVCEDFQQGLVHQLVILHVFVPGVL